MRERRTLPGFGLSLGIASTYLVASFALLFVTNVLSMWRERSSHA